MAEMNVPGVEYRDVVGCPGYKVGSDGSMWTCRQTSRGMTSEWKPMKCSPCGPSGYIMATLRVNKRSIRRLVQHLVLETFVGPRPCGLLCLHDNDIATDNRLSNLSWGTRQKNYEDRDRNGGTARGERSGTSKLTQKDVVQMRCLAACGMPLRSISKYFPVGESNIGQIVAGISWSHAGGPITRPCLRKRQRVGGRFIKEVA